MATAVDAALDEIKARRAVFEPQLEGLYDYRRLNILDSTKTAVEATIVDFERRINLLNAAEAALTQLKSDGHPDLDTREVSAEVLNDLTANRETIEAALQLFASGEATSLGLQGNPPQNK